MPSSALGPHLRSLWPLDPSVAYLNHGTVGVTPKAVLAHQRGIVDEIEANPARFILRQLAETGPMRDRSKRMRRAAADVAAFIGADEHDVALVDNVTTAVNAVLQSITLTPDDEVCTTTLGYGGVTNAAILACRRSGATHRQIELPVPGAPMSAYVDGIVSALSNRTRLVVVDHITASTALVLPLREIAAACRERGVLVFVDGAHAPGNIRVDVPSLGVDYYGANLHKWAMAPRSAGLLWVKGSLHEGLHASVTSWGLDNGLAAEFDAPGTRDPSPLLAAPFALRWLAELGGDGGVESVLAYNRELALRAGSFLADRWDVEHTTPAEFIGSMISLRLPGRVGSATPESASTVAASLHSGGVEVPVFAISGSLWLRVSAQVYVSDHDIERLAAAVESLPTV